MDTLYRHTIHITAADCNAQFELPISHLAAALVETATCHATLLGIDFTVLQPLGLAWVLLRLDMHLDRTPRAGDTLHILTWVAAYNRRFSERRFELQADGVTIGRASTVWTIIDSSTRQAAALERVDTLQGVVIDRGAPLPRPRRVRWADIEASPDSEHTDYRVVYSDIDTNRHLTAPRYIQLLLDLWGLEHFDTHRVAALEIAYSAEARYGETLTVWGAPVADDPGAWICAIRRDATDLSTASVTFAPR